MVHNQLHAIDLIIIAAYLISMVLIGVVVVKKVQSMDDYYLGGRSFGPLVLMATVCATIIGGSGLMGRAGVAYSSGFKAIMTALPYLLGMFIFSGFAGRISAVGTTFHVTSIPDLFEQRFGKTTKVILGGLIAFTMMGTVASQVTATATIINMLGNEIGISYEMGALIACVVFIVYTATSGLFGVIYTDVFQFVMLILFVYILIPSASLVKLGGLSAFLEGLAPELAKPYLDGGIVGDIITYFVFTLAGAEMWQRAFAAKSQKAAKEGLFLGTLAYGLTIPLVWFMGVVAHQLVSAEKLAQYGSTDAVVPALAIEILPVGLTGLALAGILSVIMSTADSYLIVSVQTCVHDIYKVFNPTLGSAGDRPVHQKRLQHPDVRVELLRGDGGTAGICSAVLEKGHQGRHHRRYGGGFHGLCRLETGGGALRPRAYGPRRHCLRCCIGWSQSGYLSEGTDPLPGPLSERGGPLNG